MIEKSLPGFKNSFLHEKVKFSLELRANIHEYERILKNWKWFFNHTIYCQFLGYCKFIFCFFSNFSSLIYYINHMFENLGYAPRHITSKSPSTRNFNKVSICRDGNLVASPSDDGTVRVYNAVSGLLLYKPFVCPRRGQF